MVPFDLKVTKVIYCVKVNVIRSRVMEMPLGCHWGVRVGRWGHA